MVDGSIMDREDREEKVTIEEARGVQIDGSEVK